jgi:hypothetical protein
VDVNAISAAIAAKYLGLTAGGETIKTSTEKIPTGLPVFPAVQVYPPEIAVDPMAPGKRYSSLTYKVDFFHNELVSDPADYTALGKWLSVLVDVMLTGQTLGGLVVYAWTASLKPGAIPYDGQDHLGIEITLVARLDESVSPTA